MPVHRSARAASSGPLLRAVIHSCSKSSTAFFRSQSRSACRTISDLLSPRGLPTRSTSSSVTSSMVICTFFIHVPIHNYIHYCRLPPHQELVISPYFHKEPVESNSIETKRPKWISAFG